MILRALWLRPMARNPVRFLATVVGVAIGVASVVATLASSRAAVASLRGDVQVIAGAARLEVSRAGGVAAEDLAALRPLCDELLFVPVIDETALVAELGDIVRVLGVDLLVDADVRALEFDTGAQPARDALEAMLIGPGVALSRALADELGTEIGAPLELLVRSRRTTLEVAGIFEPAHFSSAWDRVVVVDVGLAQEIFGRAGRFDRIEVLPRSGGTLEAHAARIRAALPATYSVDEPESRSQQTSGMVAALEFNLTALSGISILVAIVLVATTLATSVVQRRGLIALLRSLGASRGQIARAVLGEAASIGLVGGVLGVIGGAFGARGALGQVRSTVATVVQDALPGEVHIAPAWIVAGILLGLLSSLAAAILPLREALHTPPVQVLRGEHPESVVTRTWHLRLVLILVMGTAAALLLRLPAVGGRPVYALVASLLLLGALLAAAPPLVDLLSVRRLAGPRATSLRVAQAALEAGRTRAAWAAGAVAVAVALAVAMTTMIGSFRATVIAWTAQAMGSDLFVRPLSSASGVPAGRIDPEVVERARALFGLDGVDAFHSATCFVQGERVRLGGAELAVAASRGGVPFRDGRPPEEVFQETLDEGGAVVNESFARRFGVDRGDTITIETHAGTVERRVHGVFYDYSSHNGLAVIARDDFLALYPDDGPRTIEVFLGDGADAAAARTRLVDDLGGRFALDVMLGPEIRAEVLAVFDQTFAITMVLQMVASTVAVIAVLTVLFALVSERKRELALVRVLGGSRRQVAAVVVYQAGLLGVAGALGGLVMGLVVGWVLVKIVNVQSFGWTLHFLPPWRAIGWTAVAVLPACLAAGVVPALTTARMTPQEVLRETG